MIERLKQSKDQDDTRTLWLKVEELVEEANKQEQHNRKLLELSKLNRDAIRVIRKCLEIIAEDKE